VRASLAGCAFLLVISACSLLPGGGTASPSPGASGSPLASPSGRLDAQVPMPAGFPTDVPIYTGARLTAGASFASSGQVAWGMEWQTLDSVAKVQAFYAKQLDQGDWTISWRTNTPTSFTATFTRKSNSHVAGTLAGDSSSGVTKILMSLVSPT